MANPARAYLATQVETTTQGELLIMLYEAAIKFLKRAKVEIDNKDYAKKGIYISKALAIVHELAESLNKEKGGDITPKLAALYQFCNSQLVKANIRMDKKRIDTVIQILDGICSAYAQIVPTVDGRVAPEMTAKAEQPVPQAPAPGVPPAQTAPAQPTASQPEAAPAKPAAEQAPQQAPAKPATPPPPVQPTLRTAANAAKFRAANAYTNANR